jgi:TRAP-type mannitol/chloroaromatic compound transport system permease small subunit
MPGLKALYNARLVRLKSRPMPIFYSFCCRSVSICEFFTKGLGASVAWLTGLMAAVTAGIVLYRLLLGEGSIAVQESLMYMHALVIMLASAYTLSADGHVRVDIFYRRYRPVQRAWVNACGAVLFLLPFTLFTVMISWDYVVASWQVKETSTDAGGLPAVFLLKSLLLVNGGLLTLQGLADLLRNLLTITFDQTSDATQ